MFYWFTLCIEKVKRAPGEAGRPGAASLVQERGEGGWGQGVAVEIREVVTFWIYFKVKGKSDRIC